MFDEKRNSEILKMLRDGNAKRVLVQVPEGLKTSVQKLADFLEKNGVEPFISIEPCFGACDLRGREAKALGCDALLHIGHADMEIKAEVPVFYYAYYIDYDFVPLLKMILRQIKFRKICLVSTVQFLKSIESAKKFLEKNGFTVYVGGSVLGCDASNARRFEKMVDCYLFIGSGRFHPLGLQEKTQKPVMFLDIERRVLEDLSEEMDMMKIRKKMRLEKAKDAKKFGILVSTKPGQNRVKRAVDLKIKLARMGKNVYILAGDYFTAEKLLGLKIDVLVNTACPRIREDYEQFNKIILDPEDVNELAEKKE